MNLKITFGKIDHFLIIFLSVVFLLFAFSSIAKIGLQRVHYFIIFFAVAHLMLFFSKGRRLILLIGAFEYFLLGLLFFFSISVDSPDQKVSITIFWPNWVRIIVGALIFLICSGFSAALLAKSKGSAAN